MAELLDELVGNLGAQHGVANLQTISTFTILFSTIFQSFFYVYGNDVRGRVLRVHSGLEEPLPHVGHVGLVAGAEGAALVTPACGRQNIGIRDYYFCRNSRAWCFQIQFVSAVRIRMGKNCMAFLIRHFSIGLLR